jgi:hypothetical protein
MKLMRAELDNINLDKLALAVTGAARTATPYADADVEAQLAVWLSGLEEERQVRHAATSCIQHRQRVLFVTCLCVLIGLCMYVYCQASVCGYGPLQCNLGSAV